MLTPVERQALKGQAHTLKPVVILGDKGLTTQVLAEIDRALKVHELIKIRMNAEDREERGDIMATICRELNCESVQIIGKILVIFRQLSDQEREQKMALQVARKRRSSARQTQANRIQDQKERAEREQLGTRSRGPSSGGAGTSSFKTGTGTARPAGKRTGANRTDRSRLRVSPIQQTALPEETVATPASTRSPRPAPRTSAGRSNPSAPPARRGSAPAKPATFAKRPARKA